MGLTVVDLTVKHPQKPSKSETAEFLVDSGASYTVIPEQLVKKLALKPSFYREFTLADGKRVKRPIGSAVIQFGNEEISSPVVLGQKGDSALLGAITLGSFGLALDPFQRNLYRAKILF